MKQLPSLFLCSLLCMAIQIQAQTPTIKWGPMHNINCVDPKVHDGYYYTYNNTRGNMRFFEKVDMATAEVVMKKEYDPLKGITDKNGASTGDLISTAGGLFLVQLIGTKDKFSGGVYDLEYVIREVDTGTLEIGEKLYRCKALTRENFDYTISPDRKLFCVYADDYVYVTTQNGDEYKSRVQFVNFNTISKKGEPVSTFIYPEDANSKHYSRSVSIYNNGTVKGYLELQTVTSKTDYSVIPFELKAGKITYPEPKDSILVIGDMAPLKENKFLVAGTYQPSSFTFQTKQTLGYFIADINPSDGELSNLKMFQFSEYQKEYENSKEERKIKGGSINVERIFALKNGEVVVVLEKTAPSLGANGGFFTETRYKIVVGINPDGSVKYEKNIPFKGDAYWAEINDNNLVAIIQESNTMKYICIQPSGDYKIVEINDPFSRYMFIETIRHAVDDKFIVYYWKAYKGSAFGVLDLNN